MNGLKTAALLALLAALAIGIGGFFFHAEGAIVGLVIALVVQGVSYFQGANIALKMAKARPVATGEIPWLEEQLRELSRRANIPEPKLYVSPDPQPNAFAAGRSPEHAVVCINSGLLQAMPHDQVMAVLAHELGHVKNRDILTGSIAAALATMILFSAQIGRIGFLFGFGGGRGRNILGELLAIVLAPIAAMIIQMAISRTREYAADREAAHLVGSPEPMIAALRTLEQTAGTRSRTATTATAHLYTSSPLSGRGLSGLFSTHPSVSARIQRLSGLGASA